MSASILVVDDQTANLELLEHLLQMHGHQVRLAPDAETAIALLASELPDLILMDLQLPGIDGFELTRRLKADESTRSIPIVAVTSYAMSGDAQRALAAGCDGYVSKPIDVHTFPGKVAEFLKKA
jgi:two-component system, cell cycle response regulator DivK